MSLVAEKGGSYADNDFLVGCICTLVIVLVVRWWFNLKEDPIIVHHPNHPVWKRVRFSDTFTNGYNPPSWLCVGTKFFCGSIHTILHTAVRMLSRQPVVEYKRELIQLSDGGTVGLDWAMSCIDHRTSTVYRSPPLDDDRYPILFLHHGLCGSSQSQYILAFVNRFLKLQKFRIVVLVARGCGDVPLTTPEGFIAARTLDMRESLEKIFQRNKTQVFGIGFSLGAGLMANYIGEEGYYCKLSGAIVISPCWDFLFRSPWFKIWSKSFLASSLINYTRRNFEMMKKNTLVDLDSALSASCVETYDTHAVLPIHGYKNVKEYYQKSSPLKVAKKIIIPTLSLNAEDDPVCSSTGCPTHVDLIGPGLVIAKTKRGGHIGWASSLNGHSSWMDDVIDLWINACFDHQASIRASKTNKEQGKRVFNSNPSEIDEINLEITTYAPTKTAFSDETNFDNPSQDTDHPFQHMNNVTNHRSYNTNKKKGEKSNHSLLNMFDVNKEDISTEKIALVGFVLYTTYSLITSTLR